MEASKVKTLMQALARIPDKAEHKDTTSKMWKENLAHLVDVYSIDSILEIGSARGHSLYVLAPFVSKITGVELSLNRLAEAKALNKQYTNITYYSDDVYVTDWKKYGYHDLVIIDCMHTYQAVISDIENALAHVRPKYLAFDDYGLFPDVKRAVDTYIDSGALRVIANLGLEAGQVLNGPANPNVVPGRKLVASEGVLCAVNNN